MWDFVSLRLDSACVGHRSDVVHMRFWETGLLVSSDILGDIFIWRTRHRVGGNISCLGQLVSQSRKSLSEVLPSINSFCFLDTGDIVAGNDAGRVFLWKKEQIVYLARGRGLEKYFEDIHAVERVSKRSSFQPYRIATDTFCTHMASKEKKKGLLFQKVRLEQKRKQSLRESLAIPSWFKWKAHRDSITGVSAINTVVFTASLDLSVKLWDTDGSCLGAFYSEDICLRNLKTHIPWVFGSRVVPKPTQEHFDLAKHVLETTEWRETPNPEDKTDPLALSQFRQNTPMFTRNNLYTPKTTTRKTQLYRLSKKVKAAASPILELSPNMQAIADEATKQKAFSRKYDVLE